MSTAPTAIPTTRTTATLTLVAMVAIVVPLLLRSSDGFARWLVGLAIVAMGFVVSLTYRRPAVALPPDSAARTSRLLLLEAILIAVLGVTGLMGADPGTGNTAISVGQFVVAAVIALGALRLFRYARSAPAGQAR